MPYPFLTSFIAENSFIAVMLNRVVFRKLSCQQKIDQGEEEMAKQSGMESGATEEQHDKVCERHQGEEEMANQSGATEEQHNNDRICEHLPEELIIESILTRLPVRTLAVCSCVRKYWYNSIHNDLRFSAIHYNQNKNKPSLVFHLLNVSREGRPGRAYCFSFLELEKACPDIRILLNLDFANLYEVVGFCNGLACFKVANAPDYTQGYITVINQSRAEIFVLNYLRPAGGYLFLGHGFGFDSLSQVYKVVIVFTSKGNDELLCMIVTLGTMSWRKILTSIVDISPPPGSSPFPSPMVTRVSRTLCRQATFCRGDLFWRTKSTFGSINDMEMLLSFDLHDEKIHFIQLPTECTMTLPSTTERQYLADDHLLEFKGYPCIARSERITTLSNNDHSGHCCNYRAGLCCCCYKVHMYILKDKDKQVWTREETFDVQIMDHKGSQPTPLCCLIKTRTPFYRRFNTSVPTPRTRLLTFSGQVLLYWFNGERLILYNLQEKYLKAVECSRTYPSIFQTKMNEDLERLIGDDDNIYCPSMDYQLHAQVENIVSLETFIPKEAKISECNSAKLQHLYENNLITGWLTLRRKRIAYAFS